MDHYSRLKKQVKNYLFGALLISSSVLLASLWLLSQLFTSGALLLTVILAAEAIIIALVIAGLATNYVTEPVRLLGQAILHVSPGNDATAAPNLQNSKIGRELITGLCLQVYQIASSSGKTESSNSVSDIRAREIAANLPLPLIVMDKTQNIVFANGAAHKYLGLATEELNGKNFYEKLNLSFSSPDTLDNWLKEARSHAVTSSHSWEHVRLQHPDHPEPLQFDMAAFYNKENPHNVETIVTLFDHTSKYAKEDDSISFIALAVHELRTPLTLLRGYIEVFEEELSGKLSPELANFMDKMQAAAQQLSAFVNNILNVARIEADQMVLQLKEDKWNDVVARAANDLKLRADIQNKTIELNLAAELPPVAIDKVSIYEVLSNLLDNAIKYSGSGQKIIVTTSVAEGDMIETTVQDFGVGIATNIVPHLFEKFYRNYHTQQQIGGTGLGLYLSKAIISAHGGNIWVRSKEGEGTTIGFTLKPYAQVADELKNSDNKEIVRNAHGWIKNHSMFRK